MTESILNVTDAAADKIRSAKTSEARSRDVFHVIQGCALESGRTLAVQIEIDAVEMDDAVVRVLLEDVLKRRYVWAGFAAFLCLVSLAVTSTRAMIRRLGRRWVSLHRLVYLAATLAVVHFLWLVKSDLREPLLYAAVLTLLLGLRLWFRLVRSRTRKPTPNGAESQLSRV